MPGLELVVASLPSNIRLRRGKNRAKSLALPVLLRLECWAVGGVFVDLATILFDELFLRGGESSISVHSDELFLVCSLYTGRGPAGRLLLAEDLRLALFAVSSAGLETTTRGATGATVSAACSGCEMAQHTSATGTASR